MPSDNTTSFYAYRSFPDHNHLNYLAFLRTKIKLRYYLLQVDDYGCLSELVGKYCLFNPTRKSELRIKRGIRVASQIPRPRKSDSRNPSWSGL